MPRRQQFYHISISGVRDLTYLDSDSPAPAGTSGDETFPATAITSRSANTTPADSHLVQIFLECFSFLDVLVFCRLYHIPIV